jgi:hypothetical protein
MRSRVCSFQFLAGIASPAFLRSESHGAHEFILLSLFLRLPQPGGPGSCIYFPQEQGNQMSNLYIHACFKNNIVKNRILSEPES